MVFLPKHRSLAKANLDIDPFPLSSQSDFHVKSNRYSYSKKTFLNRVRWKQLSILYLLFLITIHYFERTKPYNTINSCIWSNWESWPTHSDPHHSVLVGDPQIVDDFSYPTRPKLLLYFTKLFSDNYLHRNHQIYNKVLKPNSILYIGDLFDGGREWTDSGWLPEYSRFHRIFNNLPGVRQFNQIPGNHDVGFGEIDFEKYSRFRTYFGDADTIITLGNHSVVLLDTVSLSCKNDTRVSERAEHFLNTFKDPDNEAYEFPRILLTHVPLYRFTETQTCGPIRESKHRFPVTRGKQYQTVLEYELSQKILNWIKPSIIFSGDDHDYCHVRHPFDKIYSKNPKDYEFSASDFPGVRYSDEVTVKSSAMTGGIKQPAIQLISMWNPQNVEGKIRSWQLSAEESKVVDAQTIKTQLCYLPKPYQPLVHYSILLSISLWWIFICTMMPPFAKRLNGRIKKLHSAIKNLAVKKSISLLSIEPKRQNKFEKFYSWLLLDWNIEPSKDWKAFVMNSLILIVSVLMSLLCYFNSI